MRYQRTVSLLGLATALAAPAVSMGTPLHPTALVPKTSPGEFPGGFARTADGTLHVDYETNTNWGMSANGVGAISISPGGTVGAPVQALSWSNSGGGGAPNGVPGLAVLGGTLQAVFGGSPNGGPNGPWGVASSNGGATWSAPANIGSGVDSFGDSNSSLAVSNGTPVIASGCCGGIVIQQGFGPGANTYQLTNSSDNVAAIPDLAVDASTGAVVAGWDSNAGPGGVWLQQVAPSEGAAQQEPLPPQYGTGVPAIVAARDTGPGVYATYAANNASTTNMRLLRYGGGSVPVGSVNNLHANVWGAATGSDGRIWVMWYGTVNGQGIIAVTRSNKAVTRFEPIQQLQSTWSFLFYLEGDGRLGPLDMLWNGTPAGNGAIGGVYYARVLPELSAHVSVKDLGGGKFKLKARVNDAGDPVGGATVAAGGHSATTSATGKAKLQVTGSSGDHVTVKITAPTYRPLSEEITL